MICENCEKEYGDNLNRCSHCNTPNYKKIMDDLLNSTWILKGGFEGCSKKRGFYMLYGDFKIDEDYLKVGKARLGKNEDGLKRRIQKHYNSRLRPSVLARHLYYDKTFSKRFNLDLTTQSDRKIFLRQYCFFKILPTEFLCDDELRPCEKWIEDKLRNKIRYIDAVIER